MRIPAIGEPLLSLLAASLLVGGVGELHAQGRPIDVPSVTAGNAEPSIDGRLDDPAWEGAALVTLDYEWFPGDNTTPVVATECRLLRGATELYVGCRGLDHEPASIRGHYVERDEASGDDAIRVLLDPSGTSRRGYWFEVTALGVQSDALFAEDTGSDESWDATWASAAGITSEGFSIEMAVPFRALRRQSGDDRARNWGMVITRLRPRSTTRRMGSMLRDRDDSCFLCQAVRLSGLESVATGRGAQLQPTLTATRAEANGQPAEDDVEVGLSGRWSPAPATRVSFTANPDFSQVEADAAEFEINRRFALSFDEKRPFFLDDADFFDVSEDLLFTRTVVDPLGGAKLTLQRGAQSVGAIVTLDRLNSRILPGNQDSERVSTEDNVVGLVGRYRRDLPNSSSVGLLTTGRLAPDYHNVVVALDGTLRLGRSHRLRLLIAGSNTDDEAEIEQQTGRDGGFGGVRWNARYDLDTRNWEVEAGFRGFSEGYRADAGLVQRVDLLGPEFQIVRLVRPAQPTWYDRIELGIEGQRLMDFGWDVVDEKIELFGSYEGPLQSEVEVAHAWRREAFGDELFSVQVTEVGVELRPSGPVALGAFVEFGDEIDSDNDRLARFVEFGAETQLLIGRSLRIGLNQRWQRLSIPAGRVFRAALTSARIEYHFGLRLFLRTILQYRDIERDPSLWVEPVSAESNRLFAQVLLSYELTPETVFFAGYAGTARDFEGLGLDADERAFFVKLGYGWQF